MPEVVEESSPKKRAYRKKTFLPIQRPAGGQDALDRVIWSVAELWNAQETDETAYEYIHAPFMYVREPLMSNAIFRYSERDLWRLGDELRQMADAIYASIGPLLQ
jgi:hypothetical protein